MHAVRVEAVPARPFGVLAVAFAIELGVLIEEVVLAWNIMHVEACLGDDALGVVELGRLGEMRNVSGVDHEGGLGWKRFDLRERLFEGADHIGISRLVEADMAVADLHETELARLGGQRSVDDPEGARDASGYGPQHPGAGPSHAFQDFSPAQAGISAALRGIAHGSPPMLNKRDDRARSRFIPASRNREDP